MGFIVILAGNLVHAFILPPHPDLDPGGLGSRISPDAAWERLDQMPPEVLARPPWVRPAQGQPLRVNPTALSVVLKNAPVQSQTTLQTAPVIYLPLPDGTFGRFRFVEAAVMAPELAAHFPELKTYLGAGIDDPTASVRFDLTPAGFHAQILSASGVVYIDPCSQGDAQHYTSFFKRDYARSIDGFLCQTAARAIVSAQGAGPNDAMRSSGTQLRTYRLAVAATGEYTAFHGGTVPAGMSAIVTAINRVNGIYETELAIRLVLVANNSLLVYTSGNSDPYSNNDGSAMLSQNQANLDSVIGSANYDIGHVFSTGGGGIATVNASCSFGNKARGVTGLSSPTGDGFYVDYVAHEMGHQFGANHCFNAESGNCANNRNTSSAYEPGGGSTIMSYAGLCAPDNLQVHSDPYFNWKSYDEIMSYVTTGGAASCPTLSATGNSIPMVNAAGSFTIPRGTPFALTATGSDPDGDTLTYCWEERDLGPPQSLTEPDNGLSPLFRSFSGTTSPMRTFPKLAALLSGVTSSGERLPATSRALAFRVTVRDNRAGGGGVNSADQQLIVTSQAGPFAVTSPNQPVTWFGPRTITWNVAGTTNAPVNATNVSLLLSTDGGQTFPLALAASTPNDGSEIVVLPELATTVARIKVAAVGNVFFDISDANFTIQPSQPFPHIQVASASVTAEGCDPTNGAVDPGEAITLDVTLENHGTDNTSNLVVSVLDQGGVTSLGSPQTYGVLTTNGASATRSFILQVAGACGDSSTVLFHLRDGTKDLGTVSYPLSLGAVTNVSKDYTNSTLLTVPASGSRGPASLYPSSIEVSGAAGTIASIKVTLHGLSHSRPDDLDILLVAPDGRTVMLMSDVGGSSSPLTNLTLTFDDGAASSLPDGTTFGSGTWKPTNSGSADALEGGAPPGPYGATLDIFNGASAMGTWSLYAFDDSAFGSGSGSIAQGWSLELTIATPVCCGNASRRAPVLQALPGQTVAEGSTLALTNIISDPGAPPAPLTFTLGPGAPAGASIHPTDGLFVWTPTEAEGPGTNQIPIVLTPQGAPDLSVTQILTVVVTEMNSAPQLTAPANRIIYEGEPMSFQAQASDGDLPTNRLTFFLESATTSGASLDPAKGLFTWTAPPSEVGKTNAFTLRVQDDGSPPLSDSRILNVAVVARPMITSITASNGAVALAWQAIAGRNYRVQFKSALGETNWNDLAGDVVGQGSTASKPDAVGEQPRFYRIVALP